MSWVWIVVAVGVLDALVTVGILIWALRRNWGPLVAAFPAREPDADALSRRHQTFASGLLNLGWSVHVDADAGHLHLTPVRWLQRLGAHPVSIPWEAIAIKMRREGGRFTTVTIGAIKMKGPAWCLDLADPDAPEAAVEEEAPGE